MAPCCIEDIEPMKALITGASPGIGGATAYNQLDRLVDGKAITGFAAAVNHGATGQTVAALVLVYVEQGR